MSQVKDAENSKLIFEEKATEKPFAHRVKDFHERFGISASTFWKLVSHGQIRVVKLGGRTLVPQTEVDRILKKEEVA